MNTENRPFYIVDHDNGEYSLCLALSFLPEEYEDFGQEAFNRYAVEIGDPVMEDGYWFTHGSGHEWRAVFEKAFEDDPNIEKIEYDCETGGFFCYGEKFAGLVSTALKEAAEKEELAERIRNTLRGFLTENPEGIADIMTPDGFLHLTADQGRQLLNGDQKSVRIGDSEGDP